jgi:hypothetical protein
MDSKILDVIQKARPTLKMTSLKSYERNLKKVFKLLKLDKNDKNDINDLKWILETDDILKSFEGIPNSSKRVYYATLIVFMKEFFPNEKKKQFQIATEINKIKNEMTATSREQKMNDKEKKNWMSWGDIQDFFAVYYKRFGFLLKKKYINTQEKECLQRLLLLAIFTQHPPRRASAYVNMRMENDKSYKKIKKEMGDKHLKYNYIVYGTQTCFIFNNYKTDHTYGQQVVQIKPKSKLTRILRSYCKLFSDTLYLFSYIHDETKSLNSDAISKKLKKIFMTEFKKAISSTMIRHIYISHMYSNPKLTLADKDKIASNMGHSQNVASEVYHKIQGGGGVLDEKWQVKNKNI